MSFNTGLIWPWGRNPGFFNGASVTLDATGEYVAFIGYIVIDGQATSKTIDTTGSIAISFSVANAPVFDNAGSVFTVGFQGVDNTTGFPVRPDGTWAARSVVTTAANTTPTLTTSSDYHVAVPTAGTTTLSHGDQVCVVFELTTKAGTDALSVISSSVTQSVASQSTISPATTSNITGAAANVANSTGPNILITFSDGTIGYVDGGCFVPTGSSNPALTWTDGSATDEYGNIFQVPFACSIDAIVMTMRLVDATSDFTIDITSTPLGTPASIISGPLTRNAENFGVAAAEQLCIFTFPPVSLTANTDYCVSVKATGAGNIRWNRAIAPSAAAIGLINAGGTTTYGVSRNAGTGAYGTAITTIVHPIGVRISNITAGSSGGGMRLAGHGGLAA